MDSAFFIVLAIVFVAIVIVAIFAFPLMFLSALARALRRVSPENRQMAPDQVWLNLIPIFNVVWASVTVDRVATSLHNEYVSRGLDRRGASYGRKSGFTFLSLLAMLALTAIGIFLQSELIIILFLLVLAAAFCFCIAYWVQIDVYVSGLKAGAYRPPTDEEW